LPEVSSFEFLRSEVRVMMLLGSGDGKSVGGGGQAGAGSRGFITVRG
jgi:hypothetical protein